LSEHFITRQTVKELSKPTVGERQLTCGATRYCKWTDNGPARTLPMEVAMNVMYNSENYYVVEFPGRHGIELVDKTMGRSGFLEGAVEVNFRASMADLAAGEPSEELVDGFLGHYDALLINSVALH
jgi:hypothetical protein